MKLGIAITTYNRAEHLLKQIGLIRKFCLGNYELIVCDDGSSDNTIELLEKEEVSYISSENKGVAWNKNRGIYYLANYTSCDAFLLLDDDILPCMYGWDVEWRQGALLHGHVNYISDFVNAPIVFGRCTAHNPGLCGLVQGAALAISREALQFVGYMDNRFGRYGHEHTEYTNRFVKAGFGGIIREDQTMLYAIMNSGLEMNYLPSSGSLEEAKKNEHLLNELGNEPLYRFPWFNEQQRQEFLSEFEGIGQKITIPEWEILKDFDRDFYLNTYSDVRASNMDPVTHYLFHGRHENRKRKPE
ncbi:glycosyltransferase family 2 protein [Commensalibacter communis]|uniref:GT2 family (WcaE) n=1 Tax=Commensalibacter communis TaxID=2972786 RepID=A0A9W4XHQ0_9PROT|nr:glycosyltransferase [Commensalibacter communis]CAI3936821.1 GT2 family (WcaE) (PDB:2Z86) [Commensalibacter communis]CAI3938742.1 GT2 family (WcaE) (PDB:2Z86) [Commensalibacter communis]CAI3941415.1 GT2 family (WcaE) (PDB:2Z86) [Commensalibacter communis]CAI3941599.1 GT2 family (WcaE) (PDB:2Z86) [Commensalibacter communis]CAI3944751.1 GT2 family (WcaE) (PDB:2Z86) [Commensalibacter communis]